MIQNRMTEEKVDKKIITARGPVVAFKFGERFGKILIDE